MQLDLIINKGGRKTYWQMSVREAVAGLSEEIREMAAGDKGADAGYRHRDRNRI